MIDPIPNHEITKINKRELHLKSNKIRIKSVHADNFPIFRLTNNPYLKRMVYIITTLTQRDSECVCYIQINFLKNTNFIFERHIVYFPYKYI